MQGSLDDPPIIIRTSREWNLVGVVVCAVMTYFRVYVFGLGVIYFCWQLIDPSMLALAPEGLTWKTSFKRRRWAWNEVVNFRPMLWGQVGCDLFDKTPNTARLRNVNENCVTRQNTFGF